MSKAKFTKGEWVVTEVDVVDSIVGSGSVNVCVCRTNDAHLIAAAPEMYEELKKLSSLMDFLDKETHPNIELDCVKHDIDKLLTKARGE